MSSLVVFPFKSEDIEVFRKNIREAVSYPRVGAVLCVGYEENECYRGIQAVIPEIEKKNGKKVHLIVQERLGDKRPGKGDGMNTALKYFLEETDYERIHFYDSDIATFSQGWISQAEAAGDEGYQVVRHYFPRASTDAMVTWMITKTGFAILWPDTELPFIEQPLGGELMMSRQVAEALISDETVLVRSDWGIDTAYTWSMANGKFSMFETYVSAGKLHKLYGALSDLKDMAVECFDTIQELKDKELETRGMVHRIERPGPVPEAVKEKTAYDLEGSLSLLMSGWTKRQIELLDHFPHNVEEEMRECSRRPRFKFMDDETWYETYKTLLEEFNSTDEDWRELLFKLWIARVLNYTSSVALRGYDYAFHHLYKVIEGFARTSRRGKIERMVIEAE
jgi:mannosylglycerate synthase